MRQILSLIVLALLIPLMHAQDKPAPVRICVAMLENTSRHIVNPTWERDQLVRALERTNKSKEVKKGRRQKLRRCRWSRRAKPTQPCGRGTASMCCTRT